MSGSCVAALREKEGAGNAGCWPHPRVLRAKKMHFAHASNTGQPKQPALPAQRLYGLYVVSSVRRASGHRPPESSPGVDPSIGGSGPHDFTVRVRHARLSWHPRPSHPRLTVRDDRPKRPSSSRRDARECPGDLPDGASENMCDRLARRANLGMARGVGVLSQNNALLKESSMNGGVRKMAARDGASHKQRPAPPGLLVIR